MSQTPTTTAKSPEPKPAPRPIFAAWLSPRLRSLCFGAGDGGVPVDDALDGRDDDEAAREEERRALVDVNELVAATE